MKPTQEQIEINNVVNTRNNLVVQAGAGTGKSTTLRHIAQENPENFLVLCFNSANATESNEHPDKPSNMYYSTIHSVAYKAVVDKAVREKLAPYLNYKDLPDNLFYDAGLVEAKDAKEERIVVSKLRKGVQDTITLYCRSDSENLLQFATEYFSRLFSASKVIVEDEQLGSVIEKSVLLTVEQQTRLTNLTRAYWLNLIDTSTKLNITHDVYLKLFHLRKHKITDFFDKATKRTVDIQVLCIDEAQDTNLVSKAIFDYSDLKKVIVGDSMQQLYAWRGAGDMMDKYPHFETRKLSASFRFNNYIADLSNVVLARAKSGMRLEGYSTKTEIKTTAILCRTNSTVLNTILTALRDNPEAKFKLNIDFKDLTSKLYHLNALWFNQVPKYPNRSLKELTTKADLIEAMELNQEIVQLCGISQTLSNFGTLTEGIKCIQNALVDNDKDATYTISTIHKSKGLEWDEVIIADDFLPCKDGDYDVKGMWENHEQLCLLYVAITRAKVRVTLPYYLQEEF